MFLGASEISPFDAAMELDIYEQEFANWKNEEWKPQQEGLREELLGNFGNRNRYRDLVDAVKREQVIPLVGSGMSVTSGLPTWAQFLVRTGQYAQCDPSELDQLVSSSAFEEAADLLADHMPQALFAERVEHNLRIDNVDSLGGSVCLLPNLFPNLVVTINLDNVLENLYYWYEIPFAHTLSGRDIARYRQLKNPKGRFLIKLHGDCNDQQGRVLLSREYDEAYAEDSSIREEIALLYRNNSVLFLGCSLGPDRIVRLVHEIAGEDLNMPKHFAFLENPVNDDHRLARESFLTERGIFPIWYELPHDESITALLDGLEVDGTRW